MTQPSPKPCRRRWGRLLERAFVGAISARGLHKLRAHAAACAACRATYDRYGEAERALWDDVFPEPAAERSLSLVAPSGGRRASAWAMGGALAASAAMLALWLVVERPDDPADPASGEFAKRGVAPAIEELASGEREPGIRLFCIEISDEGAHVRDNVHLRREGLPAPALSCTIEDELQVAYSTPNLPGLTMTVFAESQGGEGLFLAPPRRGEPSVALEEDAIDTPLDWSTQLAGADPGRYEVRGHLFFGEEVAGVDRREPLVELRAELRIERKTEPQLDPDFEEGTP